MFHMLKSNSPVRQNMAALGDWTFKDVIKLK